MKLGSLTVVFVQQRQRYIQKDVTRAKKPIRFFVGCRSPCRCRHRRLSSLLLFQSAGMD